METYHGYVRTPGDAIKLFEACRLGLLPRVQRRLSEKERKSIRSGSVFVWDEREAGMGRWTDGKSWSASRVSGSFLTYREMEGKRGGGFGGARRGAGKTPESSRNSDEEHEDVEPEGYRYKADGLMKQSFSITTSTGQHLHLISYYYRPQPGQPDLPQPSSDPNLRAIVPAKGMYPESSMGETNQTPTLTRAPMQQPYMIAPQHGHGHQPYTYTQPGYAWPLSPAATPPYGHYAPPSYPATVHGLPPPQTQAPPPPTYSHGHYTHATTAAPERTALPPLQASKASPLPPYQGHYVASHPPRMHDSPGQKKLPTAAQAVIGDARLNSGKVKGVHGPLPGLNSVTGGTSSACHAGIATPPTRHVSISPPRSSLSDGSLSRSGTRPSFSALLHPTPNSEPASVKTVSNGSVNSSPRAHGLELTKAEDLRALRMLDRKFCI